MKRISTLFLPAVLILLLLGSACAPVTPTTGTETSAPGVSTETATASGTENATVTGTPPSPTAGTPQSAAVAVVCGFCVKNNPHIGLTLPEGATFQVTAPASGVSCSSVEVLEGQQVVLCHAAAPMSFTLNVCLNGQCADHALELLSCSQLPTATAVPTSTATATATLTATPAAGSPTAASGSETPSAAASVTATPTP